MREQIRKLVETLNAAADAYYNGEELISNYEYDQLYEQLMKLETETGIVFPDSPTVTVGTSAVDSLPKIRHEYPALSLAKTKDMKEYIRRFSDGMNASDYAAGCIPDKSRKMVLMWKLDGSTIVAVYDKGKLKSLSTRGNGEVGNLITHNARAIKGLPLTIPYKGKLVVRGEAVMSYSEFDRINQTLPEDSRYKNPRNLANATISLHDSKEAKKREIFFKAFTLVEKEDKDDSYNYLDERFNWLSSIGFDVVEYAVVNINELEETMRQWEKMVASFDFPVDGLVSAVNAVAYSEKLKGTGHNPHIMNGYAFKWKDDAETTVLRDIYWSPSRTGLLNPVAVFDPVELEGTTVTRASLHNVSFIQNMDLKIGDRIDVIKANKIIPQVVKNHDQFHQNDSLKYSTITSVEVKRHHLPEKCPVCHKEISYQFTNDDCTTVVAMCTNPDCTAKKIGAFVHFCERDCMNIIGLSERKLVFLLMNGYIHNLTDIYKFLETEKIANKHGDQLENEAGWDKKSVNNLKKSIQDSKTTDFIHFIHALGIPGVGKGQAKAFYTHYIANNEDDGADQVRNFFHDALTHKDLTFISGIGSVICQSLYKWADNNLKEDSDINNLLKYLEFPKKELKTEKTIHSQISQKIFVITGSLEHFKNRDALKSEIEANGGKVSGSVSKKTDFLINNDTESTSGKNKKAKELGITIISETEFLQMLKQ